MDGTTQGIFALRQLEQGESLSHRTLRLRHTTQLRSFGVGADLALFSGAEAESGARGGGVGAGAEGGDAICGSKGMQTVTVVLLELDIDLAKGGKEDGLSIVPRPVGV